MPRLQDRVVIVTGGGHGIGRAYSQGVAADGGKVIVADIDQAAAQRVADALVADGAQALGVGVDVSQEDQAERMAQTAIERFGKIDGLVNNAAIFMSVPLTRFSSIEETTVAEWDRVMAVNVKGVFLCAKAVVPHMKRAGYGKIINISSTTVLHGQSNFGPYQVSKMAIIGITRGLARELGAHNIEVNTVAPGGTLSADDTTDEAIVQAEHTMNEVPPRGGRILGAHLRAIRRVQRPGDLVGAVVFLLSAESDFITGQTIVVDGGGYMS
jgi:3-oxoacyl-[acyl-carrier protein] reductase